MTPVRTGLPMVAFFLLAALIAYHAAAEHPVDELRTFSEMGKEVPLLEVGKEVEIFSHEGKGCLTHMWFALDERLRIRVYVDGEEKPSIDMHLMLGHGYVLKDKPQHFAVPEIGYVGGQHNTYRIPFGESIRVTLLPLAEKLDWITKENVWWIIRGTENLPVSVGGVTLPERARLKLYTLEDYTAKPGEEFTIADVDSAGALYQTTLAVQGERPRGDWMDQSYQEGCVRAYFGDDEEATYLSSGLEDYFLGSGYFHHSQLYANSVAGLTTFNREENRFSAYRFHDRDPVFFQDGMRLTMRNGEELRGTLMHDPPPTTYNVHVWVYEW